MCSRTRELGRGGGGTLAQHRAHQRNASLRTQSRARAASVPSSGPCLAAFGPAPKPGVLKVRNARFHFGDLSPASRSKAVGGAPLGTCSASPSPGKKVHTPDRCHLATPSLLELCPALHTPTPVHSHSRPPAHTHTHPLTLTPTSHSSIPPHLLTHSCLSAHTHTCSQSHPPAHTHLLTHTYVLTQPTCSHASTHSHLCTRSCSSSHTTHSPLFTLIHTPAHMLTLTCSHSFSHTLSH